MGIFRSVDPGYWTRETHIFKADVYICSRCRKSFGKMTSKCPGCGARMKRSRSDPKWIDELEAYDALFEE